MKSIKIFEQLFIKHLKESNVAGGGGVFGDADSMGHGGAVGLTDFYAPGDARLPKGGKKKTKKKKKKDESIQPLIPTQRRPLVTTT